MANPDRIFGDEKTSNIGSIIAITVFFIAPIVFVVAAIVWSFFVGDKTSSSNNSGQPNCYYIGDDYDCQ